MMGTDTDRLISSAIAELRRLISNAAITGYMAGHSDTLADQYADPIEIGDEICDDLFEEMGIKTPKP